MSDRPRVSVCLTTYNRSASLGATLDSILSQTFGDFELIVGDDHSSDATAAVCAEYAGRDPRIRYYRNARNLGMPGNLNAAIARARGEYVANLHDGDWYRSSLLASWTAALDRHPTAAFVFCPVEEWDAQDRYLKADIPDFPELIPGRWIVDRLIAEWGSIIWGTVMARRTSYEALGPFDDRFGFVSDVDMWMRLAARWDVAYVREPLIAITPRESNHPYAFVSWRLLENIYDLHAANIRRRDGDGTRACRDSIVRLNRLRNREWLRGLAICARRRRWGVFLDGLGLMGRGLLTRASGASAHRDLPEPGRGT